MSGTAAIARRYRDFVDEQVRGRSPIYVALGLAVAKTPEILAFLSTLPAPKQQPNLLLAAVRHVCGVPADGTALAAAIRSRGEAIRAVDPHGTGPRRDRREPGRPRAPRPTDGRGALRPDQSAP